jgi:hypothetical protein
MLMSTIPANRYNQTVTFGLTLRSVCLTSRLLPGDAADLDGGRIKDRSDSSPLVPITPRASVSKPGIAGRE